MGMTKDQYERGYSSPGDKYVCRDCINDYAIQEFIDGEAEEFTCSYCGKTSDKIPIAAHIDNVIEFILDGIETEYDDPRNGVSWESAEGGWVGAEVLDTSEILFQIIGLEIEDEELSDDITQSILQDEWCRNDPYGMRKEDEWYMDWEDFSKQVKYQVRYIFYRIKKRRNKYFENRQEPYEILDKLAQLVRDLNLIKPLPRRNVIFRARRNKGNRKFVNVNDLGPPKNPKQPNRMSPAGIPMFYGSMDENTALDEIRDEKSKYITVAAWKILRKMKFLDLTSLPPIPSLFDQDRNYLRPPIIFLHSFLSDFAKRIQKDGNEHIEYVPTQIVTEYFRHIFRDEKGKPIQGIIYPSSLRPNSQSIVLFCQSEDCIQDNLKRREPRAPWLKIQNPWLSLVSPSIKRIKLSEI